jgi:hypothetical protein
VSEIELGSSHGAEPPSEGTSKPAAPADGWHRVRAVGKRVLPQPVVERVHTWRAERHRVRKEREREARRAARKREKERRARRREDREAPAPRAAREQLYWSVASVFHEILGDGRMLVSMPPDDSWSVSVRDTRSSFHGLLRIDPDGDSTEAFALGAAQTLPLGRFEAPQPAVHALLRALLEHADAERPEGPPGPARRIWIPVEDGRPVPRLLRLGRQWTSPLHRSGWAGAMEILASLHDEEGVLFDGFLESTFCWKDTGQVYDSPWVGVCHSPPGTFPWTRATNDDLFESPRLQRSLPWCRGLFVLSEHHRGALRKRVDVPVSVLPLPTETPERSFSLRAFEQNPRPRLVQIGHWLRHPSSLYRLRVAGLVKTRLDLGFPWEENVRDHLPPEEGPLDLASVEVMPRLSDGEYDALLACNLVFLHLLGSSANNAVVECVVRGTPLLVNPLPAVVEHLGPGYPLYFDTLEEAGRKATDPERIRRAHRHLRALPKQRYSREGFLAAVVGSEVYRALRGSPVSVPAPSPRRSPLPFQEEASRLLLFHATHHKAGTHWLLRILQDVTERYGLRLARAEDPDLASGTAPDVLLDYASQMDLESLPPFRGSHMIRDPRDMVVSGYFYHLWTHEAWVQVPEARYDGRTYQQYLNAVDRETGLLEEIERCAFTFGRMAAWRYDDPRFFEIRYEDLMGDSEALFRRLFTHYGFAPEAVEVALEIARRNSFERRAGRAPGQVQERSVLRSGRPGQWREHFTPGVKARFQEAYGDLLIQLGYERDAAW